MDIAPDVRARAEAIILEDYDAVVAEARRVAVYSFENIAKQCESPIEQLMLAAMAYGLHRWMYFGGIPCPSYLTLGPCRVSITPQMQIGPHRVDFGIVATQNWVGDLIMTVKVVVECDGHDYHERTKDQAERDKSRDRYLVGEGWTVLRFTGREIVRDPKACVAQTAEIMHREFERQCALREPEVFDGL